MLRQAIEYQHEGKIELAWRRRLDLPSHCADCPGGESVGFGPVASRAQASANAADDMARCHPEALLRQPENLA
jgi:hypothetical protein